MTEYTAQNLEYAVSVFYNGEQVDRARAHSWLTAAQRVPEAWNFVWELLQPNKGTEIQFYGATTLHTKILRCWYELPPESYEELQQKILQAIFTYSNGPKIVTNRLCISLAAFILQQGTINLADILRPLSSAENMSLLLEVLTVIPEEYNSMTMGTNLRSRNRNTLQQACPAVLDDMLRCLQTVYSDYSKESPSEQAIQSWLNAATCACSWLTLGGEDSPESGAGTLDERMPLCRALLSVVHLLYTCNECVSDTALDACEACLAALRAAGGGPDTSRQPHSALRLLTELAALAAPIIHRDNVPNSINEELVSAVITCCVALGESHSYALVKAIEGTIGDEGTRQGAKQLIELLLAAQAAPGYYPLHETRSNLVFGFWYTLQDEILNVIESSEKINPIWQEVFTRLLDTLVCKSEAPEDSAMSKDDQELLRCYRQDIGDTVIYCFGILGDWCWSRLEAAVAASERESGREAALHVFLSLADVAPPDRAPPGLMPLLHHAVQLAHTARASRTLNTALDCLGSYASWLSADGEAAAGGRAALAAAGVAAAGGALARSPPAAAVALRKLCADCAAPAAALAPNIVHIARTQLQSAEKRDVWVIRQLVSAAGCALSGVHGAAEGLLEPLAAALHASLRQQTLEPQRSNGAGECAAALLAALHSRPELAVELFRTILPILPSLSQQSTLVEPLFQILKQTISSLMDDCKPFINDIAQLTLTGFEQNPCPVGMDVVKILVLVCAGWWGECGRLVHGCVSLAAARVAGPRGSGPHGGEPQAGGPSAVPDLTEALFSTLHALLKKRPVHLEWIQDILPQLIDLACECVRMWEACGARAACGWAGALAAHAPHALHPRAPDLTAHALRCIGGATPRNHMEPLAELLLALNRAAWPSGEAGLAMEGGGLMSGAGPVSGLAAWLPAALSTPGFPTHHATTTHKNKFIAAVIKEKSSKRRLLETVQEFSLICRGLVGTEYARQTLASKQLVA